MEYKKKAFVLLILLGWISVASVAHAENFTGYITSGASLFRIESVGGNVSVSSLGQVTFTNGSDTRGLCSPGGSGGLCIDDLAFAPDGRLYAAGFGYYLDSWGDKHWELIIYELDPANLSISDIATKPAPFGDCAMDTLALAINLSGNAYISLYRVGGYCAKAALVKTTIAADNATWLPWTYDSRIINKFLLTMDVAPSGSMFGWHDSFPIDHTLRGLVVITEGGNNFPEGVATQVSDQPPQIDGNAFDGHIMAIAFTPGGKLIGIGNEPGINGSVLYEINTQTEEMTRIATVPVYGSKIGFEIAGPSVVTPPDKATKDPFDPENLSLVADPIDVSLGAHVIERNILTVQGDIPLSLVLSYNSSDPKQSVIGYGWKHSFDMLLIETGGIEIRWPTGRITHYSPNGSGGYTNLDGDAEDRLVKNGNGSFTLTDRDINTYQFSQAGELLAIANRNGLEIQFSYVAGKLDKATEPLSGRFLQFTYDINGRLTSASNSGAGTVNFSYDANDNLISITDPSGNTNQFTYDANHRIVTGTNELGVDVFTNTYDSNGLIVSQDDALLSTPLVSLLYGVGGTDTNTYTDRNGATTSYTFNQRFQTTKIVDDLGNTTTFGYDASGNRTSITDAQGEVTQLGYDSKGFLTSVTNAHGETIQYTYDANHNLTRTTDPAGNTTVMTYDPNNRITSIQDTEGNVTPYTYNAQGLLATEQLPGGGSRTYVYQNGQVSGLTNATGNTTSLAHDAAGRLTQTTDPAGNTTIYTYDLMGRLTSVTDPLGNTIQYTYDAAGRLITTTDPRGNTTQHVYDNQYNLTETVEPMGVSTQFQYENEDRLSTTIDAIGNTSMAIQYDSLGRPTIITDGLGNNIQQTYDNLSNLIEAIDAFNNKTTLNYDSLKRLTGKTDPLGNTWSYSYDNLDRLIQTTDPLGNKTAFTHDNLGRVIQAAGALGGVSRQSFDNDGNRITLKDPNNNTTTFGFDVEKRLTSVQTADGNNSTLTYNSQGLISSFTNGRGQTTNYTYDAAGRVLSAIDPLGTINFTYDQNDNPTAIPDTMGTITMEYNAVNRITKFTDVFGSIIQYSYDAVGNIIQITYPDGKTVNYTYDVASRMTQVADWSGRQTSYSYGANGAVTRINNSDGTSISYTYDNAGRPTSLVDRKPDSTELYRFDYSYNAVGKVTSEASFNFVMPAPATNNMTYTTANRLATFNSQNVLYDADGNMTLGPLKGSMETFTFDARNRLAGAGGVTYTYDAENRRVALTESGVTTRFVVNPNAILSQVLMETDSSGNPIAYYVYGLGLIGREDAGGNYQTYHYDRRGSTLALTNQAGTATDRYYYGPFGELLRHQGSTNQPFLYNGRDGVMTDNNGLYYMRARYYNPEISRFISRDILLGDVNNGQSMNRYAYVQGDPVEFVDPEGLVRKVTKNLFDIIDYVISDMDDTNQRNAAKIAHRHFYGGAIGCTKSLYPGYQCSSLQKANPDGFIINDPRNWPQPDTDPKTGRLIPKQPMPQTKSPQKTITPAGQCKGNSDKSGDLIKYPNARPLRPWEVSISGTLGGNYKADLIEYRNLRDLGLLRTPREILRPWEVTISGTLGN